MRRHKRPIDPAIGRRLAEIRIHRSCSEQALADELGVHKSTIGKWENGHTRLSTSWLPQIAQALACTAADLLLPPGSPIPPARGPLPAACRGVNPGRPKRTTKRKRVPRMTISHDRISLTALDAPFVFKSLHGVSCSVCAPDSMSEAQVVAFASAERPKRRWRAVNQNTFGIGPVTPNPCSQVTGRMHWFLVPAKSWEPQ